MELVCNVIDVGARYGVHPSWSALADVAHLFLLEMDSAEAQRLRARYAGRANIQVRDAAVYSSVCTLKYHVRKHKGLNSIYGVSQDCLQSKNYMQEDFSAQEEMEIQATTLDTLFSDREMHFLKIDTEGSELDVLKGAEEMLKRSVLGIRAEVNFYEIHSNAPLFGEIHAYLKDFGFELLNLDYDGRGHSYGPFTRPGKYGQLLATDAVWIKSPDSLFSEDKAQTCEGVIRMALFLMNNNATDLAIDLLTRAVNAHADIFEAVAQDPLFLRLKRQVAFLFKDLLPAPWTDKEALCWVYRAVFKEDFPEGHSFFETFQIS